MSWKFGYDRHPNWLKRTLVGETPFPVMTKAVPNGRMVFLDYICEERELYLLTHSFAEFPFIWNYLAHFDGCIYQLAPAEKISERLGTVITGTAQSIVLPTKLIKWASCDQAPASITSLPPGVAT